MIPSCLDKQMASRESPYDWLVTLVRSVICVANLIYIFDLIKVSWTRSPQTLWLSNTLQTYTAIEVVVVSTLWEYLLKWWANYSLKGWSTEDHEWLWTGGEMPTSSTRSMYSQDIAKELNISKMHFLIYIIVHMHSYKAPFSEFSHIILRNQNDKLYSLLNWF